MTTNQKAAGSSPAERAKEIPAKAKLFLRLRGGTRPAARKFRPLKQLGSAERPRHAPAPHREGERAPTRAVRGGDRAHAVAHLVAYQGHSARKEDHDEHLLSIDARRHRLVLLVHNLGDNQVLEEAHAPMQVALGSYPRSLGRRVHVERLLASRRLGVPPRPVRHPGRLTLPRRKQRISA
jgi:hypothetical protein